jgi:hypothetical protein
MPRTGRPPLFKHRHKLWVYLDESDYRRLERVAATAGKPLSAWARERLLEAEADAPAPGRRRPGGARTRRRRASGGTAPTTRTTREAE